MIPSGRVRLRMNFCSRHCACIQLRGSPDEPPSGSADAPTDCIDCPRLQVRKAGPLKNSRISRSPIPNLRNALYCTSSCPVMARKTLTPCSAIQSMCAVHSASPYQT
jgi:hypothetical protein